MKKEFESFGILTDDISDENVDFKKLQSLFIKDLNSKKIKNEFIAKTDELFQQEGENYLIQMAQKFGMQPLKSITT